MSEVRVEIADNVATLTLAAPERRNALTPEMAREVVAACERIDADESVGAVVVAGEGESFCAGGDRATLAASGADPVGDEALRALRSIYDAFVRVGHLKPPTIAAVRGAAVGAGLNLLLATDLRIVAEDASLIAGFQRIGVHPGGGHFTLLGRTAGREAAMALTVFGQEIDGRRAAEIGLAWEAVPASEVEARAHAIAASVARDPELARAVVRSARLELGPPASSWAAALEMETAPQLWSLRRAFGDGQEPR
jgi:enoyl-CoA hydratase